MAAALLHLFKASAVLHACMVAIFLGSFTAAQPSSSSLSRLCGTTGNYTANSTYQSNLNALLPSLATNGSAAGFYSGTRGRAPDEVYGTALCRGDANSSACRGCLDAAGPDLVQFCPYTKTATTWYDLCELWYSDQSTVSSGDNSVAVLLSNSVNVSDPDRFDKLVRQLMDGVSSWAAYNSSEKFGTGEATNFTAVYPTIYGLAQCMRDLSAQDCYQCLQELTNGVLPQSAGKQGGRVLKVSCNLRYEVYPFFSGKSMVMIPSKDSTVAPAPAVVGSPPAEGGGKKDDTSVVLAIVIPVACVLAFIIIAWFYVRWRRSAKKTPFETNPDAIANIESILFDLSTLRTATANFSDEYKLGQGGFGAVHKGTLPDGQEIAVKRLSRSSRQGIGELKNELVLVAKLQHRNLVRLLGVCLEEQEKLLVYEFVPNRSLDTFLFDPIKKQQLDWRRRYKIIEGIARGLLYLHEDSQLKIIHRDLKASNILLDADMNPKISDFGMARLFVPDQTQGTTSRVVGTFGYMAPEYAMRGRISVKSDVYSFGVLILEIVTGRGNGSIVDSDDAEDLVTYTWEHWISGTATEILDQSLGEHCPRSEALRCIQIGLLCVQDAPADRPSMSTVVLMLSTLSVSLQVPLKPEFCVAWTRKEMGLSTDSHSLLGKSAPMSANEVSVSELDPR